MEWLSCLLLGCIMLCSNMSLHSLSEDNSGGYFLQIDGSPSKACSLLQELVSHLKSTADLVLPMNLGTTGITSILQSLLEAADVPFIGPTAEALALTQHKHRHVLLQPPANNA